MPTINDIYQVCSKYSGSGYFLGNAIPSKRLANASAQIKIPNETTVIAFIDGTLTASGKHGIVICDSGLYWSNNWTTKTSRNYLSWIEFSNVSIRLGKDVTESDIELGEGNLYNSSSTYLGKDKLLQLLKELQYLAKYSPESIEPAHKSDHRSPIDSSPPLPPGEEKSWFVGISGQQKGPFALQN